MQRYFISDKNNWTKEEVIISGEDVHHILRVMRFDIGDEIIAVHPNEKAARCILRECTDTYIKAEIIEWLAEGVTLPVEVTIAQGLPKGDKFELILQKGTELGAASFIPFQADRSVVIWNEKKMKKKMERFEKIVKAASEQSHRVNIPKIEEKMNLDELIETSKQYDVSLFAYEEETRTADFQSLATVLRRIEKGMRLLLCIGPEGGFSTEEAQRLTDNNFHSVRLGPRILRTETAALYALASISYHFEEMP
jgi:16S rRNA (uracil1498-N3)-methyltransferase